MNSEGDIKKGIIKIEERKVKKKESMGDFSSGGDKKKGIRKIGEWKRKEWEVA